MKANDLIEEIYSVSAQKKLNDETTARLDKYKDMSLYDIAVSMPSPVELMRLEAEE